MDFNVITLDQALHVLGQLLADREHHYEVVAIGGGSLLLLDQIERTTKDLDLVALVESDRFISAEPLPLHLIQAITEVGRSLELGEKWLNAGPASLLEMGLPEGFKMRMQTRRYGGITVHLAGRLDQICFKLYATIDQGPQSKHFADLKFLQPTYGELQLAKKWCVTHDVSEVFAVDLNNVLMALEANAAS